MKNKKKLDRMMVRFSVWIMDKLMWVYLSPTLFSLIMIAISTLLEFAKAPERVINFMINISLYVIFAQLILLGTLPFLGLFIVIISSSKTYNSVCMLPDELIKEDSWWDIAEALSNAYYILHALNSEVKYNKEEMRLLLSSEQKQLEVEELLLLEININHLRNNMFKASTGNNLKVIDDLENATLWLDKLSDSPLLERLAVLKEIDSAEKISAFISRDNDDLIDFFQPINDFFSYVTKVHEDDRFREKELNCHGIKSRVSYIQKEVDGLFNYGIKNIYKRTQASKEFDDILEGIQNAKQIDNP